MHHYPHSIWKSGDGSRTSSTSSIKSFQRWEMGWPINEYSSWSGVKEATSHELPAELLKIQRVLSIPCWLAELLSLSSVNSDFRLWSPLHFSFFHVFLSDVRASKCSEQMCFLFVSCFESSQHVTTVNFANVVDACKLLMKGPERCVKNQTSLLTVKYLAISTH